MLSRTKRDEMAQEVANIYAAIEDQILYNIARRIKRHRSLLTDDIVAWEASHLAELGGLTQQQLITIAKGAGVAIDEVSRTLGEAGYTSANSLYNDVQEAVRQGAKLINTDRVPSYIIDNAITAYLGQARDKLNLTNTTMLGSSEQIYRNILGETVGKVIAGTMTHDQALRSIINQTAHKGVTAFTDSAGRHWTPEAYVNTVMRSTIGNTARQAQEDGMNHYGIELMEVSSHLGARELCAPYQGAIYSREGHSHPNYPNITQTSWGEPAGLFGINCGHVPYPYFEGYSIQRNHPIDSELNDQMYKESQIQRRIERSIRNYKRSENMLTLAGDEKGAVKAAAKVKERQKIMRKFIKETGRTRRYEREQVHGL